MLTEYCAAWPQEIKELAEQRDRLRLMITNLEERIRKADTDEDANRLIDDLFFYRSNCREIDTQLRWMIGDWNLRNIDVRYEIRYNGR